MLLEKLEQLEKIVDAPQRITRRAVESAYAIWAKRYPEWEAAFFDRHFLHAHVLPRFSAGEFPTAMALAEAWAIQLGATGEHVTELMVALTPVAADFLYVVKSERSFIEAQSARKWQHVRGFLVLLSGKSQTRRVGNFS